MRNVIIEMMIVDGAAKWKHEGLMDHGKDCRHIFIGRMGVK